MSSDPLPRKAGVEPPKGGSWWARFRAELNGVSTEQDRFIDLIILERLIKSALLIALAISLLVTGRMGLLGIWVRELHQDLNLDAGGTLIERLATTILDYLVHLRHQTLVALGVILYAGLEATEGIGLFLKRRWAEYLTVIASGLLIPFEVWEVIHRQTLFRVGGLLLNVVVVIYLAYRKRLFIRI